MSPAATHLAGLTARIYYLSWLVTTHPALNARDAASASRVIDSLSRHAGVLASQLIGA